MKKIVLFREGLGNQLFEFAIYIKFQKNDFDVYADLYPYRKKTSKPFLIDKVFEINMEKKIGIVSHFYWSIFRILKNKRVCYEKISDRFQKDYLSQKFKFYHGYWQDIRYIEGIEEDLKNKLVFRDINNSTVDCILNKIEKNDSVSIHVRRGDYLQNMDLYNSLSESSYYSKAISYMENIINSPLFFVFSDDIQWCEDNIKGDNIIYVDSSEDDSYEDYYDFYLMTKCKHNIIANSTYSWWAAWLNENNSKIIVCPDRWYQPQTTNILYDKDWIRL